MKEVSLVILYQGTVRQGGFTDDLSDPGNLAMIGIIVTVGTTLLQLARGK